MVILPVVVILGTIVADYIFYTIFWPKQDMNIIELPIILCYFLNLAIIESLFFFKIYKHENKEGESDFKYLGTFITQLLVLYVFVDIVELCIIIFTNDNYYVPIIPNMVFMGIFACCNIVRY